MTEGEDNAETEMVRLAAACFAGAAVWSGLEERAR